MSDQPMPHVAVLMGGPSSEHEVSISSGRGAAAALAREGFRVTPVVIGHDRRWAFGDDAPCDIWEAVPQLKMRGIDCAFLTLHGEFGEDGRIQGFFDLLGVPYTTSGCASSALTMDKVRSKAIAASQGIRVAGHIALDRATYAADPELVEQTVAKDIGFPCVIKPNALGSSVAIAIPQKHDEFEPAMRHVLDKANYILIEEFIAGQEVTCAVLESRIGGYVRALPVTMIRPTQGEFFDYHCKYTPGATEEITPAPISAQLTQQVQEMAVHVHEIMGCRLWSRSDFIIDAQGPIWLEVNTIPGLTPTSLFPQAAAAAGIEYDRLMRLFVESTLEAHTRKD